MANAFYQGEPDLLLLVIDTDLVGPQIRYEHVPGQASPYPHIYGPLNLDAVVEARPFAPAPDGQFSCDGEKCDQKRHDHEGGSSAPRRKSSWSRSRFSATVSWDAMCVMPDSGSTVCG